MLIAAAGRPLGLRSENDRLYLGAEGRRYFETSEQVGESGQIRVPIHEERIEVGDRRM